MLKQEVASRLKKIVDERFGGVDRRYALAADVQTSTLQSYIEAKSIPGGDNLIKLSRAGRVTVDWLLTGENFIINEEDIARDKEERECLKIKRSLNEEDKDRWMSQGTYYLKNPTEERAPSASKSAAKKTSKRSTRAL